MIVELSISNFAIIDDLKINFTDGFNVLTGETGAGKSIIIEGIGMLLGQRASKELVKSGRDKAVLEGLFYIEGSQKINYALENYGIDIDSSNYLLISREIYTNGPSISRINGRTVTLTMLNSITPYLMDIHGQHEHQSLLNVENHMELIDSFGDIKLIDLKTKVKKDYENLLMERKRLRKLALDRIKRDREMDLLRYQIDEIDGVDLLKYDENKLIREYNKISNIKKISELLGEIIDIIGLDDYKNVSVIDGINRCVSKLNSIKQYDNVLETYYNDLESVNYEIQDLFLTIKNYLENIVVDEERLQVLEALLDSINNLKKKYGNTVKDILDYRNEIEKRLKTLLHIGEEIEKSERHIKKIETQLDNQCIQLTQIRTKISKKIEDLITKELYDLNMDNVIFKVKFDKLKEFTSKGKDRIEFLISTNKGQDIKPLSKIISGGEMSRIMLAFKRILADYDGISSLIFDEIDSGISGRTAQVVGEKIKMISNNHQVISITHLPQIAALADTHFVIKKNDLKNTTNITVMKLKDDDRINELSRLLGGVNLTDTTKLHAKEMLTMSKRLKK